MPSTEDNFNSDLKDVHLIYDYDAQDDQGNPEKWRYEMWFYSFNRIVYAIHGGPMAGRKNYQKAEYQCKCERKNNHRQIRIAAVAVAVAVRKMKAGSAGKCVVSIVIDNLNVM